MPEGDAILIAAQSGRALAQAARRAGLRPFVLDLFGDEDTLALAEAHRTLPGRFGTGRFGADAVLAGLDELKALASGVRSRGRARVPSPERERDRVRDQPPPDTAQPSPQPSPGRERERVALPATFTAAPVLGLVLGSGFEASPDLMARIAERHRLIGAGADTVTALKNPVAFATLCARLAIPHPAVTTRAVPNRSDWVLKRVGGSGGSHIRAATAGPAPPAHYFQARVPGRAHALNFLADGRDIAVLALTEQWSAPSALRPYRFAGALERGRDEPPAVAPSTLTTITDAVVRLVAATGLRGLASADLLVHGSDWWLLEINPRPGATLDVLDRRPTPLLTAHIEASLGQLPRLDPTPADAAGSEICYAPRRYACVKPLDWPDIARDRPRAGSCVGRDAPFCTVVASGPDAVAVKESLRDGANHIAALLDEKEDIHGYRLEAAEPQRADGTADRSARR